MPRKPERKSKMTKRALKELARRKIAGDDMSGPFSLTTGKKIDRRFEVVNDGPRRWVLVDAENDDPAPVYQTRELAEAALAARLPELD